MAGVPYSDDAMVDNALADFTAQVDPNGDSSGLEERYGEAAYRHPDQRVATSTATPELTEMDALIAYIQVLGTMVDFSTYHALWRSR